LEHKLDSIVSILSQQNLTAQQSHYSSYSPLQAVNTQFSLISEVNKRRPVLPSPPKSYGGSPASLPSLHSESQHQSLLDFGLTNEEQNKRLNLFRTEMIQHFPFVHVPSSITVQSLREQKPFYFATIMLAASYQGTTYQRTIGKKLIEYLSLHLLINGERNLDLLQGLLVYIAWCVCTHHLNNPTS